jgi:hypothetical protein
MNRDGGIAAEEIDTDTQDDGGFTSDFLT